MKGGRRDHQLAHVSAAEVLTVAVVRYFQNHHKRALLMLRELGYLSHALSVSRFNRRLHACADWLELGREVLTEVAQTGAIFIIDSLGRCPSANGCGHGAVGRCAAWIFVALVPPRKRSFLAGACL